MMSYGEQPPKSFQGERFARIMSYANISKVKLSGHAAISSMILLGLKTIIKGE